MPTRWPPWIEPRVAASADTTVNSGAETDLTGATVTFTPTIDCIVMVHNVFDIEITTLADANNFFVGLLDVNGTNQDGRVTMKGVAVNTRLVLGTVNTITLTGGVSYTFKLQGFTFGGGASNTYNLRQTFTRFSLVTLPKPYIGP